MSCDDTKFVITKGSENVFTFTIKQPGSTLPMTLDGSDTFLATLTELETNTPVGAISAVALAIDGDGSTGKVTLTIPANDTSSLIIDRGSKTDRYYARPNYRLLIECNTLNNGKFIAQVPEVYVS